MLARLVHVGPLLVYRRPADGWTLYLPMLQGCIFNKYTPLTDAVLVHLPVDGAPPDGGLVHVLVVGQPHLAVDSYNNTYITCPDQSAQRQLRYIEWKE